MDINELFKKKGVAVKAARDLVDKAGAEKRSLTAEESVNFDKAMKDVDAVQVEIDRETALRKAEGIEINANKIVAPGGGGGEKENRRASKSYETAFARYLVGGMRGISADEARALAADASNEAGGYIVVPENFSAQLIKAIDNQVAIRQLSTRIPVGQAASLGVPTLDTDISDADWTTEILTGTPDSAMSFGKRSLTPNALAKSIRVSNKLLRVSAIPVDALIRERLAYKFGVAEENGFMTGDGSGKPLGLFEPSANGINTDRDSQAASETAITADDLITAKYFLKSGYAGSLTTRWIFHRDTMAAIRKLKTIADGQYVWVPGLAADRNDTILGIPVIVSEYCPKTLTTGLYYGLLGDLRFYIIADSLAMTLQVVDQLFAATNETGYFCRAELDGQPSLAEAFVRLQMNPGT